MGSRLERIKSDSASLIGSDVVNSGFGEVALTRAQFIGILSKPSGLFKRDQPCL